MHPKAIFLLLIAVGAVTALPAQEREKRFFGPFKAAVTKAHDKVASAVKQKADDIINRLKSLVGENDCDCTATGGVQDIVIVGGGPGGTYLAWRLRNMRTLDEKSILLLEANERIGGRLYSVAIPGVDFNVAEAGGMRYIPASQPLVEDVIKTLSIPTKIFEMDEDNQNRPYLLRNLFLRQSQLTTANLPYALNSDELNMLPDDLQIKYFHATVNESQRALPPDQAYTVYGDPLYYYGQSNVFSLAGASADAHNYFQDGNGYTYMFPENPGVAGNLLYVSNDTSLPTGSYYAPQQGMSEIPKKLASAFQGYSNSKIELGSTVTSINKCTYNSEVIYSLKTRDSTSGRITYNCGRKVYLSLTRSQLQRLDWEPVKTSPLLDSVISYKSTKFFLTFPNAWWQDQSLQYLNLSKGRSISSLPIRQTFYFTNPSKGGNSMIMGYNDGPNADFWGTLADSLFSTYQGSLNFLYNLSERLVNEVVRQMAINHDTTEELIGSPIDGLVMYWNHETAPAVIPNYGPHMPSEAWHMWKAGANFTQVMKDVVQLDPTQDVFIVGEAYSGDQGWVEGAFQTVDDLLSDQYGETRRSHVGRRRRSPRFP